MLIFLPKESVSNCESGKPDAHPEDGILALTCDTLLSSQGTGAHRYLASQPHFGATFLTYIVYLSRSNRPFWHYLKGKWSNFLLPAGTGLAWRTQCGLVSVPPLRECKHYVFMSGRSNRDDRFGGVLRHT